MGGSEYGKGLAPLKAPLNDVAALGRVLSNPELGQFDQIDILTNPDPQTLREAIEELFCTASKDDLVLLFFSGHGLKDDRNRLYFATRLTRKTAKGALVKSTAVPASFVQDQMGESLSRRQIVMLDCCFSGAFAVGMTAKSDNTVDLQAQLGGQGRVVLTSSTSTQYSFEQDSSDLSLYTQYIVDGIETGAADVDTDGYVSVDELHDYACRKLGESASAMQPKIYAFDQGFKIHLAKAPLGDPALRYRKEAEALITRGPLSVVGRFMLNELRDSLGISPAQADAIETGVCKPQRDHQDRRRKYFQAVLAAREQPVSDRTWADLERFQALLGLSEADGTEIRQQAEAYARSAPAEVLPQAAPGPPVLQPMPYATGTLASVRSGFLGLGGMLLEVRYCSQSADTFTEVLGSSAALSMISIPAGAFTMGSHVSEDGHWEVEGPEHAVAVATFFMGQYAVTQAQWQAVAAYPKVEIDLPPSPALFQSQASRTIQAHHPVEQVAWHEAVEFCRRLSQKTGRRYRLPSEAEWEYACRAGTKTPFCFGGTITTEVANYNGTFTYAAEPEGTHRKQTVAVGTFPANGFGLYDMHGNVWEWCADCWHDRYSDSPADGSAWLNGAKSDGDRSDRRDPASSASGPRRVIRGGSWMDNPSTCRSASRIWMAADVRNGDLGFRVVCDGL